MFCKTAENIWVSYLFLNKISNLEGRKGREMKRIKKIIAVVSIMVFVFGSFISTASASPSLCSTVPTGGKVNDGRTGDHRYFNTPTQISANWGDFVTSGEECQITDYQYRIREVGLVDPVVDWESSTGAVLFTEDLASGVLEEGEKYITDVKAINSLGPSLPVSSLGQVLDITKPTIDSFSLFQNKPYGESVTLSWSASDTDGSGIKSYQLYRNGIPLGSALDKSVSSYADTIFGDNLTFSYYLIATDEAGNPSLQSTMLFATVDDVAPAAPSISYWIGGKNIVIFWPGVAGASNYEIYRNGILIKSGVETKYTDTDTVRGKTYSYVVYALDGAGNKSTASNTFEIYVPKPRVSTVSTTATGGQAQGETTTQGQQVSPSPSPSPSGEVEATETSAPEETAEESKTNWSLIIAIIIAAAIVISGVLYWWYAREEEEDEI